MGSLHIFANLFWLSGASRRPLKRLTVVLKKSTTRPSSTSKIVEHKWKDHNHTHKHQPPQNWKKTENRDTAEISWDGRHPKIRDKEEWTAKVNRE